MGPWSTFAQLRPLLTCPSPTSSRAPNYGYMTPDPSRTPLHGGGGAWDPSVSNTPFHEQEYDTPSPASVSRHTQWASDLCRA